MGGPGLVERLHRVEAEWFVAMSAGLEGTVPSADLASMIAAAGLEVVATRRARERLDPPLPAGTCTASSAARASA